MKSLLSVRAYFVRALVCSLAAIVLLNLSRASYAQAPVELPQQPYLPLEMALQAANAALAQCEADGYQVSVAIVDRGGALKMLLKADGAGPHTVNSSWKKAYTAASLGRPTQELAQTIAENPETAGLRDMDPQILILAGGLPIIVNETLVGGIGVGGAPGGQFDVACAQAGLDVMLGATADGAESEAAADAEAAASTTLRCSFAGTGATVTANDARLNFTCATEDETEIGLFGDVEAGDEGWMIERVDFTLQDGQTEVQSSTPVQIVAIELADGDLCQFAGTGATITVDDQRLNYTCETSEENTVGLVGDIAATDDGWAIEKAVIVRDGDNFVAESSEQVLISALEVASSN